MTLKANVSTIPVICPECGFESSDPGEMVEHWLRTGELKFNGDRVEVPRETARISKMRLVDTPRRPHRDYGLPKHAEAEHIVVLVESEPVTPLPRSLRIMSTAVMVMGILFTVIVAGVAGFLAVPVIIHPIVNYGPLAPWVKVLTWLWHHGELSLPLAGLLIAMVAIPRARRKAWEIFTTGIAYIGLGILITVAMGIVGWIAWMALARR